MGILLKEGAAGGAVPFLNVLEIKTQRDQRDSTDLLPYLPKYRRMFTKLHPNHVYTKTIQLPLVSF